MVRIWLLLVVMALSGCAGPKQDAQLQPKSIEHQMLLQEESVAVIGRRPLEKELDTIPLVPIPRSHPAIGRMRGHGSLSIGTTRDGFVVSCRALPRDLPTLRQLEVQSKRGTACATDELIEAIVKASIEVERSAPGGVMTVGNLSRVGGGDMVWSVSHNSGRDVDIGFFLLGPDDKPFIPKDFVRLDRNGRAVVDGVPVHLDVRRTWIAVRSLLRNPAIQVQWIFMAGPLKRMLIEYAKRKEKPAVISMAEEVIVEPVRARPHDDHMHLRIYCSRDDLLEGCKDKGTNRPWYKPHPDLVAARAAELLKLSYSRDAATRAGAATVLGRLGRHQERLLSMLNDHDREVRLAAANAILEAEFSGPAVERWVMRVRDDEAVFALLRAIERGGNKEAKAKAFARLLSAKREFIVDLGVFQTRWTIASWAKDALVRMGGREAVDALVESLSRPGTDMEVAITALMEITATNPGNDSDPVKAWRAWWKVHKDKPPLQWYREALNEDGASPSSVRALLEILRACDYRWRGAFALLRVATGVRRLPSLKIEPMDELLARMLEGRLREVEQSAGD